MGAAGSAFHSGDCAADGAVAEHDPQVPAGRDGGAGLQGSGTAEQAAEKLIYLAIRGHGDTSRTVRGWLTAVKEFAIMFEERSSRCRAESGQSGTGPVADTQSS